MLFCNYKARENDWLGNGMDTNDSSKESWNRLWVTWVPWFETNSKRLGRRIGREHSVWGNRSNFSYNKMAITRNPVHERSRYCGQWLQNCNSQKKNKQTNPTLKTISLLPLAHKGILSCPLLELLFCSSSPPHPQPTPHPTPQPDVYFYPGTKGYHVTDSFAVVFSELTLLTWTSTCHCLVTLLLKQHFSKAKLIFIHCIEIFAPTVK